MAKLSASGRRMYRPFGKEFARWAGLSRYSTRSKLLSSVDSTGIAFIHIPKAAGTSISQWLYGMQAGHRSWEFFHALDPARFESWKKIAVIRDPAARFSSAWRYLSQGGTTRADARFARKYVEPFAGIDAFAVRLLDDVKFCAAVLGYYHFQPQADYVLAADGRIMVNYLVPFERLAEDLPRLAAMDRPIPQLNRTGAKPAAPDLPAAAAVCVEKFYGVDRALHEFALREREDAFGKFLSEARKR